MDVSKDQRCIACHASDTSKVADSSSNELVQKYQYSLEEGVSCVECHGAALDWIAFHALPTGQWRQFSRAKKEAEFGMRDLWNPVRRTELCLSCHLGDSEKGRFVTHEMYAAGHPPLPGIEVAAFGDEMPRHWEYPAEKAARINLGPDDTAIKAMLGIRPDRLNRTELIAVSGLVTLQRALEQFEAGAGAHGEATSTPDFARYDCYACHHDLRTSDQSWRQRSGGSGAPGRPRLASWPGALAIVGLVAADPTRASERERELEQKLAAFHIAAGARPFADGSAVNKAIRDLQKWIDPIVADLVAKTAPASPTRSIDRATALAMFHRLCKLADERVVDYDSARQLAWACRTIHDEINPKPASGDPVVAELECLRTKLNLSLNPHADHSHPESYPTRAEHPPIAEGEDFFTRLKAVADYDPAGFRKHFQVIAEHLPAS